MIGAAAKSLIEKDLLEIRREWFAVVAILICFTVGPLAGYQTKDSQLKTASKLIGSINKHDSTPPLVVIEGDAGPFDAKLSANKSIVVQQITSGHSKEFVGKGMADVGIVFPAHFAQSMQEQNSPPARLTVTYSLARAHSSEALDLVDDILMNLRADIIEGTASKKLKALNWWQSFKFWFAQSHLEQKVQSQASDATLFEIILFIPFSVSVLAEIIKESPSRLDTLLVTPLKRSEIVATKVFISGITALLLDMLVVLALAFNSPDLHALANHWQCCLLALLIIATIALTSGWLNFLYFIYAASEMTMILCLFGGIFFGGLTMMLISIPDNHFSPEIALIPFANVFAATQDAAHGIFNLPMLLLSLLSLVVLIILSINFCANTLENYDSSNSTKSAATDSNEAVSKTCTLIIIYILFYFYTVQPLRILARGWDTVSFSVFSLALFAFLTRGYPLKQLRDSLSLQLPSPLSLLFSILPLVVLVPFRQILSPLIYSRESPGAWSFWAIMISIAISELLSKGVFLGRLRKSADRITLTLLISGVAAICRTDQMYFWPSFALGIITTALTLRTKSIVSPMAFHIIAWLIFGM
jgi:ABC-type Na+ efflux pump permease subunit